MANDTPRYALRPVTADDDPFLLRLYAETRAAEMALVPWSDEQKAVFVRMQFEAQRNDYAARNPDAEHTIVVADGEPAGRLWVARLDDAIRVLDVLVLEARRGAGIGGAVLLDLMREAERTGRPLRVYVETFNPSLRLFERLGFVGVEESGMHRLMEYAPGPDGAVPHD